MSFWIESHRFNPKAAALADRHYNRQSIGAPQFAPPGACIVLLSKCEKAVWVTSWPMYVRHEWKNAWNNTLFRNESTEKSSLLIKEAVMITAKYWDFPSGGLVTFVDPRFVEGTVVRGKRIYGYCYKKAGFEHVGFTKVHKLWVWQLKDIIDDY